MTKKYILNARGEPQQCDDILDWGAWYETASRRVAVSNIDDPESDVTYMVSTVFLGLDHCHFRGPPILWETMVFKGEESLWFDRCSGSREQAEAMHDRMCRVVINKTRHLSSRTVHGV